MDASTTMQQILQHEQRLIQRLTQLENDLYDAEYRYLRCAPTGVGRARPPIGDADRVRCAVTCHLRADGAGRRASAAAAARPHAWPRQLPGAPRAGVNHTPSRLSFRTPHRHARSTFNVGNVVVGWDSFIENRVPAKPATKLFSGASMSQRGARCRTPARVGGRHG